MIAPIAAPTTDRCSVTIEELDVNLIKSDANFAKIIAQPKRRRIKGAPLRIGMIKSSGRGMITTQNAINASTRSRRKKAYKKTKPYAAKTTLAGITSSRAKYTIWLKKF